MKHVFMPHTAWVGETECINRADVRDAVQIRRIRQYKSEAQPTPHSPETSRYIMTPCRQYRWQYSLLTKKHRNRVHWNVP